MARLNRAGLVFLAFGASLLWLGYRARHSLIGIAGLSAGLSFLGLGIAYLLRWPGLLGKTSRGRLLPSSYVFFWPYHLISYGSLFVFRALQVVRFQEVIPGLYLGGRLFPWEQSYLKSQGILSVLDLTCEFSEVEFLRRVPAYCCIPLLDAGAPLPAELEAGIRFITERLRAGPVYVHCAMGHGRAPTFVAGFLLHTGAAPDLPAAVQLLRRKRPGVRLNAAQRKSLEALKL